MAAGYAITQVEPLLIANGFLGIVIGFGFGGLLIADVADAIADRRVTPDETQDLRAKWNGLRKRAETFVRRCEQGDYGDGK